jgi:hypothetical protein
VSAQRSRQAAFPPGRAHQPETPVVVHRADGPPPLRLRLARGEHVGAVGGKDGDARLGRGQRVQAAQDAQIVWREDHVVLEDQRRRRFQLAQRPAFRPCHVAPDAEVLRRGVYQPVGEYLAEQRDAGGDVLVRRLALAGMRIDRAVLEQRHRPQMSRRGPRRGE